MDLIEVYRRLYSHCNSRSPTAQEEISYLYGILGVLDSKASALMRFDAIMIAAASLVLVQGGSALHGGTTALRFWLGAILVFSLGAAGLCLWVVQVAYPFLGKVKITSDTFSCDVEIQALNKAAERRTRCYRFAWWFSVAAVLIFFGVGLRIALT